MAETWKEGKKMENTEFTVIETQEQLDAILKGRLEREAKKHSEATAGLQSEIDALKSTNADLSAKLEQYAGVDEQINDMKKQIANYEADSVKTRIAKEVGIPYEMRDRLRGETEEEIKADAESLLKYLPKNQPIHKSSEIIPASENDEKRALKEMLSNL